MQLYNRARAGNNYRLVRALPRHPGVRYILSPGRVIGDVNNAGVSHPKKRPVTILQICSFFSHKSGSFSLRRIGFQILNDIFDRNDRHNPLKNETSATLRRVPRP